MSYRTEERQRLVVLGAGGHAKVLVDALHIAGAPLEGVLDPAHPLGSQVFGVAVLGGDAWLEGQAVAAITLVNGIGANPATRIRRGLFDRWRGRGFHFASVRHISAIVAADARLGEGSQVLARAVLQPGAVLADNVVVNTGAIIEHDCELASHVFISPGAVICGGVRIGAGAFVGAGAVVLPGLEIGEGAIIGAGTTVIRNVSAGSRAVGSPANTNSGAPR